MPLSVDQVVAESRRLGARSYTISLENDGTARIHLEPEKKWLSKLRVFISYTTADQLWADEVRGHLKRLGFRITYFRSTERPSRTLTDREIQLRLSRALDQADYVCALLSEASAGRPWVRFEFKIASKLAGRIVLLTKGDPPAFSFPQFSDRLTVKWTRLPYINDGEMPLRLGRALLNDPDEGVTDGRYRPLVVRERNLRRENHFRRLVRLRIERNEAFASKNILAVLPFSMKELGGRSPNIREIAEWFVTRHGRLNLRYQLMESAVKAEVFQIPARDDPKRWSREPTINALIVWKDEWDREIDQRPNNTFQLTSSSIDANRRGVSDTLHEPPVTVGRHKVPVGTMCSWPGCGNKANGSVADNVGRVYLCLSHLTATS